MTDTPRSPAWPPGRILILVLLVTFVGLIFDLRIEHVEAVRDEYIAWMPIAYSTIMSIVCLIALFFWRRVTRMILLPLFVLSMALAGLGFYEHNHHHFDRIPSDIARSWTDPEMEFPKSPPHTAPLAFAGLGLLGALACLKRFN